MYDSNFFKKIPAFFAEVRDRLMNLESYRTYPFTKVTGADGTVVLDYSSMKFTKPPTIACTVELATKTAIPVSVNLVGSPTATSATFVVQRVKSIVGLLPSYEGVAGVQLDILLKPNI